MNRFTKMKEQKNPQAGKQFSRTGSSKSWVWSLMAKIIMIAVLIFGAHFARVVFKAKTESLNKEVIAIERKISMLKQETLHLRNRKAALSDSRYIRQKTRKLGLRAPEYHQIQHVALLQEPRTSPVLLHTATRYAAAEKEKNINSSYVVTKKSSPATSREKKDTVLF